MPTRSPETTSNEMLWSTFGPSWSHVQPNENTLDGRTLTSEYRAESSLTSSCPLAGQYAGGTPSGVGLGSCSMTRYCWMRSKLSPAAQSSRPSNACVTNFLPVTRNFCIVEHANSLQNDPTEGGYFDDRTLVAHIH